MQIKDLELKDLITNVEAGNLEPNFVGVEFKSSWQQEYGKDISAIANCTTIANGWLLVGINDKGVVTAKNPTWSKETEDSISNHIRQYLTPAWAVGDIVAVKCKGSDCVAIYIKSPGDVVYWNGNAYSLTGTQSSLMKPHEITALSYRLPGADYSKMENTVAVDPSLVVRYSQKIADVDSDFKNIDFNKITSEELLRKLNIINTNAANILFGSVKFRLVHFDKNGDPLDQKSIPGLYNMLSDNFIDEILSWTRKQSPAATATSTSIPEENPYPIKGLREILANAVAHSYFQRHDGDVVVELHPNRITVSNICNLDAKAFVNKWFSRAHKTHNKHLMNTLRACKITDEQGSGKIRVFRYMLEEGRRQPIIEFGDLQEYGRWSITLYNDQSNEGLVKLNERLLETFSNPDEARIAQALLLWRKMTWTEILSYLDENFKYVAEAVLGSKYSPVIRVGDRLYTKRWASIALDGQVTKQFSESEKNDVYSVLRTIAFMGTRDGNLSSEEARDFIGLSDTQSEIVQMSRLMSEWETRGLVENIKKGHWRFKKDPQSS